MVGPKQKACNCHCEQPFPDCFGCLVLELEIPTAWQMDFPSPMSYLGATTGSCSWLSAEYNEGLGSYPKLQDSYDHSFTFPDISTLGDATPLEIDDAPVTSPFYTPFVECVWASGDYEFYERGFHTSRRNDFGTGCDAAAFMNTPYSGLNAWEYKNPTGWITPPSFSGNRTRTSHPITDARCGTVAAGCVADPWVCSTGVTGSFATLQVVDRSGIKYFVVNVYWYPLLYTLYLNRRKSSAIATWKPNKGFNAEYGAIFYIPSTLHGTPTCPPSVYPYATSLSNLGSGLMLRYEKMINCSTDFDGTPVTLTLAENYKQTASATQTKCEAVGITSVPSTIEITPI
jgi:hypothetical protein